MNKGTFFELLILSSGKKNPILVRLSMGQLKSKITGSGPGIHQANPEEGPPSASGQKDSNMDPRKTSIYNTIDTAPQLEYYANTLPHQEIKIRPSLDVLRKTFEEVEAENAAADDATADDEEPQGPEGKPPTRFGWFIAVWMRCMLNIWGVILFLRLTWITSQAGIVLSLVIITMAVSVTTTTALSISAIATNGRVKSGGTYFMISRTLGPELGASIGLIFSIANALAVALHTVGFSEVVRDLMRSYGTIMVDALNDVRIIGVVTVTILLFITFGGMDWEAKAQIFFFIVLMASFADYLVGTLIPPSLQKRSQGFFGYNKDVFIENLTPNWRGPDGNFFRQFAIFFPACTGILSGANISGDLKDPSTAIPKGTLMAIFCTTLSYVVIVVTSGASVVRDASGNMTDLMTGNSTDGCLGPACKLGWNFTKCVQSQACSEGLANYSQVMGLMSGSYYLIVAGIFAATLSSALGFLVSAPKIFQCLCKDNVYPYIIFFAKGYGKNNEPLRGYILTYLIAVAIILVAQLNIIAPIISNFFLCSYALINLSCFHASLVNSPGWRPAFKYYNKWTALYGALASIALMFAFTWWAALITWTVISLLFLYIAYLKKPNVNWGSSIQASSYNMALSFSVSLTDVNDHVKNFRPQCLVMTGPPQQRPALVDFVGCFTKHVSLMICGNIIMEPEKQTQFQDSTDQYVKWLNKRKVRSFYTQFTADSLRDGVRYLIQASGLGKLKPNTLVLGFKSNWMESSPKSIEDYIHAIYDTFDSKYCLCILRMMDGLDITDHSDFKENQGFEPDEAIENNDHQLPEKETANDISENINSNQIKTVFKNAGGKKTIDIYWIADDGGLILLVPYLLTRRKCWRSGKIRVFILGDEENVEESRDAMIALLKRFRIDVTEVVVMTDTERSPQSKNMNRFLESVAPYRLYDEQQEGVSVQELKQKEPWKISDKQLEAFRLKSERKVRLNEIIRKNSQNTTLVLVSLPVPHGNCPSALYIAWLDALTCGLHCPVVLVRGNQENVLTFYCQ
ncbi:solute carrier family 12 member 3-like isoform X2 [Neolamprologus brichardi]|uniref:solute carrier family 12 member 3-like isoform X2 n=1 Tax=Neolamprologus brichardi TaxID=32507 RepID=UPI001643E133|nr:solute carrier family 12 member 3-like isoform X2 [Neolamprologus brichardi]